MAVPDQDKKFLNFEGLSHFKDKNDANYIGEIKVNNTAVTKDSTRKNGASVNISVPVQGAVSSSSTTGYVTGADVLTAIEQAIGGGGTVVHDTFKTFGIKQDSTTTNIVAAGTSDTLTIEGGSHVTLTADASTKKLTIAATVPSLDELGITASASSINTTASSGITSAKVTSYDSHINNTSNPHGVTKAQVGLENVTNNAQVKGLSSGTTSGHFVTWGADGYTVADSGKSASDFATSAQGQKADNAMPKAGGTFTGTVALAADPTSSMEAATKQYVDNAVAALPEPMVFKGSLGSGGTISSLPTASASNEGFVYKVITAGTYAGQAAKVGDLFVCGKPSTSYEWIWIPSGDEPSGTVTSITAGTGLSGGTITTSGTISLATVGTAGTAGTTSAQSVNPGSAFTIPYVTVDQYGRVSAYGTSNVTVSNPTAITKAEIDTLFATA